MQAIRKLNIDLILSWFLYTGNGPVYSLLNNFIGLNMRFANSVFGRKGFGIPEFSTGNYLYLTVTSYNKAAVISK